MEQGRRERRDEMLQEVQVQKALRKAGQGVALLGKSGEALCVLKCSARAIRQTLSCKRSSDLSCATEGHVGAVSSRGGADLSLPFLVYPPMQAMFEAYLLTSMRGSALAGAAGGSSETGPASPSGSGAAASGRTGRAQGGRGRGRGRRGSRYGERCRCRETGGGAKRSFALHGGLRHGKQHVHKQTHYLGAAALQCSPQNNALNVHGMMSPDVCFPPAPFA